MPVRERVNIVVVQLEWRLPAGHRVLQILRNPTYAGALAYGRTESKTVVEEGRARKSPTRNRKPRERWKVLIIDNHPGYITWKEYLENQSMLESNASQRESTGKGAAKRGAALLAGLLRCGHCGRKLFVAYSGTRGRVTRYACQGAREHRGSAACQSFGGVRVERAVIDTVLETVKPAGVQAALDAMEDFDQQQDEKHKARELALEKARYEADRARRQYDAVDPANRLVAGELEARWNVALERVMVLEQQCEQEQSQRKTLSETERTQLLGTWKEIIVPNCNHSVSSWFSPQ